MTRAREREGLTVEGLSCVFGKRQVLSEVSLSVAPGSVVGVVGPNGSGKTTLINGICGLVKPVAGQITIFGLSARNRSREVRELIGLVPQETALYADLTVRQNLRFACDLYGVPETRIGEVLAVVNLEDRAKSRAKELSGGMQRRLALARALLHQPRLLIMDEPTIGIDVDTRHQIWSYVRSLRQDGRAVLLTTNHLDEAEALCDRVILLRGGHKITDEPTGTLLSRVGRPIELHGKPTEIARIANVLRSDASVRQLLHEGPTVTVFLQHDVNGEAFLERIREFGTITNARVRSPDLAEVFTALGAA